VDNIKMELGEIGLVRLRIGIGGERALVNPMMNLRVPSNADKLSSGFTTGGLWSSAQLHSVSIFIYYLIWMLWILIFDIYPGFIYFDMYPLQGTNLDSM
jgi:hypothetical protein